LWLINTHNGVRERGIPPIDILDYPAIKNHLDQYYNKLEKRQDKGITPYNLRNCAYLEEFNRPKIIYPETVQSASFVGDKSGLMLDKTCFMLISNDAKYLLATLNSKLFQFAYKRIFSSIELGKNAYQYNKHALIKLPISIAPKESIEEIIESVELLQKDNDNKTLSEKIDKLIYKLYNISEQEIEFIESSI